MNRRSDEDAGEHLRRLQRSRGKNAERPRRRLALIAELAVNLLLPWLAYRLALPYWGETGGLIASAIPPLVWGVAEFIRRKRMDALSSIVLLGIGLSFLVMTLGGSPRLLLMRESLVSGLLGVAFLLSLLARKPLVLHLARATLARQRVDGAERFETLWRERPGFAPAIRKMTVVWGVGLVGESVLRLWFAMTWPIERALLLSHAIGYGIFQALTAWTVLAARRLRRAQSLHPERES